MAKYQAKTTTRSNKTVRYEKGHKVQRFLLLDRRLTHSKRNGQTLLNIFMKCTLS